MTANESALWAQANPLYDAGLKLEEHDADLSKKFKKVFEDRRKITSGHDHSSKAAATAFEELQASDQAVAAAIKGLLESSKQLETTYRQLRKTGLESVAVVQQIVKDTKAGRLPAEKVKKASADLLDKADESAALCKATIGTRLILQHLIVIALHDVNARYLDRKAYTRSKAVESAVGLLEGAGHDALHVGVLAVAHGAGVLLPHVLLVGTLLAAAKVAYHYSKSQIDEARNKLDAATDQFKKMYTLQRFNEQVDTDIRDITKFVEEARLSADAQIVQLSMSAVDLRKLAP